MKIVYPRGGGGHWLANTIFNLSKPNPQLPRINVVYDTVNNGPVKEIEHAFEVDTPGQPDSIRLLVPVNERVLFSTEFLFNQWLNTAHKNLYYQYKYNQLPLVECFFQLSNHCKWLLGDANYHSHYCENIGLEYSDIFVDPEQFVQNLYTLMDQRARPYHKNTEFVYAAIDQYKSTVLDPELYHNNLNEMFWLAYCHAQSILQHMPINGIITMDHTLADLQAAIAPISVECAKLAQAQMFKWKK
jgi:hypothetical protein